MTYWHNNHSHTPSVLPQALTPFQRYAIIAVGILIALIAFACVSVFPFKDWVPSTAKNAITILGLGLLGLSYRYPNIFRMYMIFLVFGAAAGFTTVGII